METDSENEIEENPDAKEDLVNEIVLFVTSKGGNVLVKGGGFSHVPLSLVPTEFSSGLFEFAKLISPIYNTLVDKIARNQYNTKSIVKDNKVSWLETTLKSTCEADMFTKNLFDIYKTAEYLKLNEPNKYQELQLGILRSDYMIHDNSKTQGTPLKLLQVELNTIASSFGCLSSIISEAHKYLFYKFPDKFTKLVDKAPNEYKNKSKLFSDSMPYNNVLSNLTEIFMKAHLMFKKRLKLGANKPLAILMIVLEEENNSIDQKLLEYSLYKKYSINIIRKTLKQVSEQAHYINLFKKENLLVIDEYIISIAYFRAGYSPNHYPTQKEWDARKLIECSQAIKCPSISYHLVGTKKVQQRLTEANELEKFLHTDQSAQIRNSFARMYSLDPNEMNAEDHSAVEQAMNSTHFVLKPQREGGGNNFYDLEVGKKLESLSDSEKKGFVLMDRIYPKPQMMRLLRDQQLKEGMGVCELGMFSVILTDDSEVIENKYAGYLLRNKFEDIDEGGVASGYACLSSLCLC